MNIQEKKLYQVLNEVYWGTMLFAVKQRVEAKIAYMKIWQALIF